MRWQRVATTTTSSFRPGQSATFADSSFDFTTLHTFAMADTVAHLANVGVNPVATTTAFDQTILAQVRADLLARGYIEITEPSTTRPDFVVLTGVSASDNYNAFITSNWFTFWGLSPVWGWVPGGVDPSWTIIYPWFNPGTVVTFQRSTLIVTIVPTTLHGESAASPRRRSGRCGPVWPPRCSARQNITKTNVQNAINIMFQQSPYLVNTRSVIARPLAPMGRDAKAVVVLAHSRRSNYYGRSHCSSVHSRPVRCWDSARDVASGPAIHSVARSGRDDVALRIRRRLVRPRGRQQPRIPPARTLVPSRHASRLTERATPQPSRVPPSAVASPFHAPRVERTILTRFPARVRECLFGCHIAAATGPVAQSPVRVDGFAAVGSEKPGPNPHAPTRITW